MNKECRTCGKPKALRLFRRLSRSPDGHESQCRHCAKKAAKKWRDTHVLSAKRHSYKYRKKNRLAARLRYLEFKRKHPIRYKRRQQKWAARNRQKLQKYQRKWRAVNRERLLKMRQENHRLNPEKRKRYTRRYRLANKDKISAMARKCRIGITAEQFNDALIKQRGCCAICSIPFGERRFHERRCADHCHETGRFRGVLCHRCNLGLGHFRDNAHLLVRALAYLNA